MPRRYSSEDEVVLKRRVIELGFNVQEVSFRETNAYLLFALPQFYGVDSLRPSKFASSSSKTSVIFLIGSPLMTFLTSSESKVSCSTRARASYSRPFRISRKNIRILFLPGVILLISMSEVQSHELRHPAQY